MEVIGVVDSVLFWVLLAVPDGVMMVLAGLGFLGVRRRFRQMALTGLGVGTVTVISRSFLPNGYHIPLILICYCTLMMFYLKVSLKSAAIAFFISSFLVNLGQVLVAFPILKSMGLSVQDTLTSIWLHIGFGWLGDAVLLAGTVFVSIRRIAIIPVPESAKPSIERGSAYRDGKPSA